MRVILDTNILLSALMSRRSPPAQLYRAWLDGQFELISCEQQLAEIRDVSRRPQLRGRLRSPLVGTLVNELRKLAVLKEPTKGIDASADPGDNFLLGLVDASHAGYLVTGDKRHLISLGRFQSAQIVTATSMVATLTS